MKSLPKNAPFELQMAALLHDIGKNESTMQLRPGNKISFINHEFNGAKLAKLRLTNLKLDNKSINFITNLISHHMDIHKLHKVTDKAVRKFLRECNLFMEDLFILVDADCQGTFYLDKASHQLNNIPTHDEIKQRARSINEELKKLSEKPFKYFNGHELMQLFNINKPSKTVGRLMHIQNTIIDKYGFNLTKDEAYKLIKQYF
jgi:poly(A) polymerase